MIKTEEDITTSSAFTYTSTLLTNNAIALLPYFTLKPIDLEKIQEALQSSVHYKLTDWARKLRP